MNLVETDLHAISVLMECPTCEKYFNITQQCSPLSLTKSIHPMRILLKVTIFGPQDSFFSHQHSFFVQAHTDWWEVEKVQSNAAESLDESQRLVGVTELLYPGGV